MIGNGEEPIEIDRDGETLFDRIRYGRLVVGKTDQNFLKKLKSNGRFLNERTHYWCRKYKKNRPIDAREIDTCVLNGFWKACQGWDQSLGKSFTNYAQDTIDGEISEWYRFGKKRLGVVGKEKSPKDTQHEHTARRSSQIPYHLISNSLSNDQDYEARQLLRARLKLFGYPYRWSQSKWTSGGVPRENLGDKMKSAGARERPDDYDVRPKTLRIDGNLISAMRDQTIPVPMEGYAALDAVDEFAYGVEPKPFFMEETARELFMLDQSREYRVEDEEEAELEEWYWQARNTLKSLGADVFNAVYDVVIFHFWPDDGIACTSRVERGLEALVAMRRQEKLKGQISSATIKNPSTIRQRLLAKRLAKTWKKSKPENGTEPTKNAA
jgi:hypothetical protein